MTRKKNWPLVSGTAGALSFGHFCENLCVCMDVAQNQDAQRSNFVWGLVLAWGPIVPLSLGLLCGYITASQKQTLLSTLALELQMPLGIMEIIPMSIVPVYAITLLLMSFSKEHRTRSTPSVVSICWSVLTFLAFLFVTFVPGD